MKKLLLALGLMLASGLFAPLTAQTTTIRVMDTALFFDGYQSTVVTSPAPPPGVLRLRNDLHSRKLTATELQSIGTTLTMQLTIKAVCDNYDRIGNINLAFVPKGASTYKPDSVQHIEIGRYITPFMNKNIMPDTVPYVFNIDNVAALLKEPTITNVYDIWVELQVFGVPYAANTQVAGCSGRNDVFYGSLKFITSGSTTSQSGNYLLPLSFQKDFNNYKATATDTLGKTTRTLSFTLPSNLTDASFFLIVSNHGAQSQGEEYSRRNHFVYLDNNEILAYKPGSATCEPLRVYNTQANGIYGTSPRTPAQWQSFSNWCPGDTIPIRRINVGAMTAGAHKFVIRVPDAKFVGQDGNFPLSVYLQGKKDLAGVDRLTASSLGVAVYPNPASRQLTVENNGNAKISDLVLYNAVGAVVYRNGVQVTGSRTIALHDLASGLYFLHIHTDHGTAVEKIQVLR